MNFALSSIRSGLRVPCLALAAVSLGCATASGPRSDGLVLNLGAQFSEDPVDAADLEESLEAFLSEVAAGRITSATVDPAELARNQFFFEGVLGLPRGQGGMGHPPALLKSYTVDGEAYLMTVAFRSERDGEVALHKVVEVKAVPHGGGYRFESPYLDRTGHLRRTTIGDVTFRHGSDLDRQQAESFVALKGRLEAMTNSAPAPLTYDCFGSLDELLKAYGFVFDAQRCNFLGHDLGFTDDGGRRFVTGTGDPNYAFEFVSAFIPATSRAPGRIHRAALVGLATYFGGYGLSKHRLPQLKAQFRGELARRPGIDFLAEFRKGRGSSIERHFVHFVICAFFMERAMEKGGYDTARKLVHSGPGGEEFMGILGATLGIDEAGFHDAVLEMIQDA